MQDQRKPILIFAQSARFLAQSAAQATYPVWAADFFGDLDTISVADRWLQIPALSQLHHDTILSIFSDLTQGEACTLICGSGIEKHYPLLNKLPSHIQLVGNSANIITVWA